VETALANLSTPSVLVDRARLVRNIDSMQAACNSAGIELWPHIKTHKMVAVARLQLAAGAHGLTCAKLGEAEAILPSGVRRLFVAHSLVDVRQVPRIAALLEATDDLRFAVTSEAHLEAFDRLAARIGKKLTVMMALDTGLGREGARDLAAAQRLAAGIARSPHLELRGFYTHEGHFYGVAAESRPARVSELIAQAAALRDAIDPALALWPGCSATAREIAAVSRGRVQALRPGAYVFGDLALSATTDAMPSSQIALHVLATVIDKPASGLALIDAGSKTFSSDRTPANLFARAADGRDLSVVRVNEEHGYLGGSAVDSLELGERILFTPAHVCPVVNLTDRVAVLNEGRVSESWPVDARGRVQ
jgi:D-serine deaminase-like pyridoxal phosphate-dependent protein